MEHKLYSTSAPAQEFQEAEHTLRDYGLIMIKRRWVMLSMLIGSILIATILTYRQTPIYRGSTMLYISRTNYELVNDEVITETLNSQEFGTFFNTQYRLLKSKSLAYQVIDSLKLKPEDFRPPEKNKKSGSIKDSSASKKKSPSGFVNMVLGAIQLFPISDTHLVEIVADTPSPELSMRLANAWAQQYKDFMLTSNYEMTQEAKKLFADQVVSLQREIAEKEKLLKDLSLKQEVIKTGEKSFSTDEYEDLNSSLTDAKTDRIVKEVHLREIRSQDKAVLKELNAAPEIQDLKKEIMTLEQEYLQKSKTYKSDYPEMVRLRGRIDGTKAKLNSEMEETFQKLVADAKREYLEALKNEEGLKRQMAESRKESVASQRKEVSYDQLKQEIDKKKDVLDSLLERQNETGVSAEVAEQKATLIRVVDPAELPRAPWKPNLHFNITVGALVGLLLGFGFVFCLEHFDRSLKRPEDVERYLQMPFFGVIPRYALPENNENNGNGFRSLALVKKKPTHHTQQKLDLFSLYDATSLTAEAIKTVRTALLLSHPGAPPKTILVTSSKPEEGKTFTACNLAVALSELQKKVVLVDADMRNPRIHRVWKMKNDRGLTSFLTSPADLDSIIRPTAVEGLSIITSGMESPRPAELIASSRFDEFLKELSERFDHIVIDSPPLMPVADSTLLATKCQSVILVIRGGETPREFIRSAMHRLEKATATTVGAVLNCIDFSDPYYHYSYYHRYYRYEKDSDQPALPGA